MVLPLLTSYIGVFMTKNLPYTRDLNIWRDCYHARLQYAVILVMCGFFTV